MEEEPLPKIMILDENILDVMRAEKALSAAGYHVVKMSTPNGALSKVEYERPEILLLDITMNRLNVKRLLQSLQEGPDYEDMIVVLFSDLDAEMLQKYCIEHDIHGYYCKSMDIDKIPEFLENFYEDE